MLDGRFIVLEKVNGKKTIERQSVTTFNNGNYVIRSMQHRFPKIIDFTKFPCTDELEDKPISAENEEYDRLEISSSNSEP